MSWRWLHSFSSNLKYTLNFDSIGNQSVVRKNKCVLFRSKYTQDGEERFAAITQLCSTDARRTFPCWYLHNMKISLFYFVSFTYFSFQRDEPALKATFDVKVSAPNNRLVLSNMPLIEESRDEIDPVSYR